MTKDVTIVIPALSESENLAELLPEIHGVLGLLNLDAQVLILDEFPEEATKVVAEANGAELIVPVSHGFGHALREGFCAATGSYVITMDADGSHSPAILKLLWQNRARGDIVIASRFVRGGSAGTLPFFRFLIGYLANYLFKTLLPVGIHDFTGGYKLYDSRLLKQLRLESPGFEIQAEIILEAVKYGCRLHEVPFTFQRRKYGKSHLKIVPTSFGFLRVLMKFMPWPG